ncbi:ATP-dependent DNA ligase [Antrihabitans sp. YC2-6]|uniref:ATP-dependent DNA ligase n=1 Tax=Antrihabitans sp. YC2-6 TaxID=2799498 RepID=UPI0018F5BE57|nr:ATP-dependent DNA ligase [Antrihabitans sp. YC2-6]MBJ8343646.1 ATP-dependent DNA ligase [Antrihabitans sp. YC2-6]
MLFAEVVATSAEVGGTRSRLAKVAALATLIKALAPEEIEATVAWLTGEPRQRRIGTGWRTLTTSRVEPALEATLSITDVDNALEVLAGLAGTGSVNKRREQLSALFGAGTADEQDFLVRLLTGDLRQGALAGVMTDAVAAAAGLAVEPVRRAAMLSGALPATAAAAVRGGLDELSRFRLEVGRPVQPMLASPASKLSEALEELGSDVSVDYKLDGARIQVHRDGDEVRIFTRTLREITTTVPELVSLVLSLACETVVLDGETLALTDGGRPRPFQETMSRFGADAGELLLHPYFFDCLYLDGVDLLEEPLSARLEALQRVAPDRRIPSLVRPTAEAAADHLAGAIRDGHEGVMVKSLAAPYAAGRRGRSWQKVKPVHTLDLVVIGAEWGYGRRTGFLSNLHLGARDPDGGPPIMVGKTFKGLTDKLLAWQTEEFPKHESHRDAHAVYLRPELVVEIALDGAQVSRRYPGGVAMRFARVVRYRPDKEPKDADTIDAVRALLPGG